METCFGVQSTLTSLPNDILLDLDKEVEKIDSTRELSLLTAPLIEGKEFDNSSFILNEEDDLQWADSMETRLTSMIDVNENTELSQLDIIEASEDTCIQQESKPKPIVILKFDSDLAAKNEECILDISNPIWVFPIDRSRDLLTPVQVPLESKTNEILDEIEEWPEFIEWKKQHGQLDAKKEAFNQNQIALPLKGTTRLKRNNEDKIHKCHACSYATNRKFNLKEHLLRHKQPDEVKMFKCDKCEFQTVYKKSLKAHLLQQHKHWKEQYHFQCGKCNFRTIYKHSLKTHILQHKNRKSIDLYKCYQCRYESMHKSALKKHLLRHKNVEEANTFKCSECDFVTIARSYLKKHFRVHRGTKEV